MLEKREGKAINERYRPMRFSQLIGNEKTKAGLTRWMEIGSSRSRSLLLAGESSCGKTTVSRILAMGLNCEHGDTVEPCLECPSCRAALAENAFHIVECNMSETNTKEAVDDIVSSMHERSLTGRNKVYILDEAQKLTSSAQNLLLKTVENPPEGVYIIFATTDPDSIIRPLRNRCERYNFGLPTDADIAALLREVTQKEGIEMTSEQKVMFFTAVKGKPYRSILFALEQFRAGADLSALSTDGQNGETDLFQLAKKIIYNGDYGYYQKMMASGVNLEYESLRCLMRTLAGKEIEKAGMDAPGKAALYYDIMELLDARDFRDSSPRPSASALFWRICAEIKEARK